MIMYEGEDEGRKFVVVIGYDGRVVPGVTQAPAALEVDMAYEPRPFVLYWSSLKKYEECPRQFLWYRGWTDIDLGRGPGRGMKIPVQKSEHHALMGDVIQRVIEELYNKELWRTLKGKELRQHLDTMTVSVFDELVQKRYVEWGSSWSQAGTRMELMEICLAGVRGYLKTLHHNRLLGVYSECEVDLRAALEDGTLIAGRADLIIRRGEDQEINPGVSILDGKNSQYKGKYTDPDQCRWYALCFYMEKGTVPDRLGFVYYRFPYGKPTEDGGVETGVDWVDFSMEDLEGLAERAREALRGMRAHKFDPTPNPPVCKFCDFETVCDERIAQKAKNSRKRKPKGDAGAKLLEGVEIDDDGTFQL